jgi:hypothetical protein
MNWRGFHKAAPELAATAIELFDRTGVVLLGTIRKDGSPRISPVEPLVIDGDLYLGMMWQSLKALDLLRDPRCTLHTVISDRMAKEGEFKLHGRTRQVLDLEERKRYCIALKEKIGWAPEEPRWHLFVLDDIRSAALFVNQETDRGVTRWRAGEGVSEFRQNP